MKNIWGSFWGWLGRNLRKKFLAGILVIVPIGITVWILAWIFNNIDSILQPAIKSIAGHPIPGVGFGITIVLIYLAGVIVSSVGGKAVLTFAESLVEKVPIVRQMYQGIKQILESFSTADRTSFMQVVLIEFPRKGLRTIGFITNESPTKTGGKVINVFVPTVPNPMSGFLQIVDESEIIRTKMSVDDALKVIVSVGRTSSKKINDELLKASHQNDSNEM